MEPKILRVANPCPQPARRAEDGEDERNERLVDNVHALDCGLHSGFADPGEVALPPGTPLGAIGAIDAVGAVGAVEAVGAVAEGGGVLGTIGAALGAILGLLEG